MEEYVHVRRFFYFTLKFFDIKLCLKTDLSLLVKIKEVVKYYPVSCFVLIMYQCVLWMSDLEFVCVSVVIMHCDWNQIIQTTIRKKGNLNYCLTPSLVSWMDCIWHPPGCFLNTFTLVVIFNNSGHIQMWWTLTTPPQPIHMRDYELGFLVVFQFLLCIFVSF